MSDVERSSPLNYVAIVAAATSAALLLAGVLAAFALSDLRDVDGTERFRLLAQAASPSVAAFALVAVAMVVHGRWRARESDDDGDGDGDDGDGGDGGGWAAWTATQVAANAALGIGAGIALVVALLALNGVVVDLTQERAPGLYRLGNVIGRLATVVLCGLSLWLAATAPAPPGSRAAAAPPPSPPDAQDLSSPE